ncbi:hypothetical protein [Nostoc sp.]|uniref:hypothetical protein n=1 Tax=Nostoc sp. TaxID=1180 RepID=UPI002FFB384A
MKKLQRVKVALRKSKGWFGTIFNQTFGFIQLMEPIEILMEGNQTGLKFARISNSKVIRSPLWLACSPDFSKNIQAICANLTPFRFLISA